MQKTLLATSLIAASLALSACGGGGGGDSASNGNGGGTPAVAQRSAVVGPLDALQDPLSSQVFGALANATAGTPLEGVLICADYAVNQDVLDIVDRLAVALQQAAANPASTQAAISLTADSMNTSVMQLANDLQGLLNALASKGACGDTQAAPSGNALGSNPLAGTPLAPLGNALAPVLAQVASSAGKEDDADLASVATLVGALNTALQSGLAQLPEQARSAPVLGALFSTLSTALNDLDSTVDAAATYNGALTADRLSTLVDHLLGNVLTEVVPVSTIEAQSGKGPVVSSQILAQVHGLSTALDGGLAQITTPLFDLLNNQLSPLMDPVENDVLAPILGAISSAIGGGAGGTNPFAGTPLEALGSALGSSSAGATSGGAGGTTGTPLDLILDPILDVVGGGGSCPVAGTPLSALCDVASGLLGALQQNPGSNPGDLLGGVITNVLGLLGH